MRTYCKLKKLSSVGPAGYNALCARYTSTCKLLMKELERKEVLVRMAIKEGFGEHQVEWIATFLKSEEKLIVKTEIFLASGHFHFTGAGCEA